MDALDESFNMASFVETGRDASVKDATLAPSDAARNHEKPEEQPSVISSVSESSFKTVFTRTWKTLCWLVYQRRSIRKARKSRILDNVKQLEQHPLGFPRAAAFFDSDEHFMIYRRFGVLFSRLLLNKQDELVELEELLSDMDDYDDKKEQNRQYLRDRFADESRETMQWTESRKEVLQKIEKKALEYSELLLRAQKLVALKCPSAADHDSAMSFMENDPAPFNERERAYIYQKQDLVTLKPGREDAWLDVIIERSLKIFRCRFLRRIFASEETLRKSRDPDIHYFTRSRISAAATSIITLIILKLLVLPVWLLFNLTVTQGPVEAGTLSICVVLLFFTLLFGAVICVFTKAKRHEIFVASAGYCAVLVVFVGNIESVVPSTVPQ